MTIPSITPYSGTLPQRSDPANFPTNADDFVAWQEGTLAPELAATVAGMNVTAAAMTSIAAGGAMSLPYTFSTTTTDADPGAGYLRLDNATQNAATVIRMDHAGSDGSGYTDVINSFDDSTSAVKGLILLQKLADATAWLLFTSTSVASPTGYKNVTVSLVASSSANPFASGDDLILKFTRNGDKGDTGAVGPTGPTGAAGAMILLGTATPTAAANLDDFLSIFSSTYDSYLIVAEGLVPNGSQAPLMRFAVAGVVDTGTVYFTPGEALTTGAVDALVVGPAFYVSGQGGTCEITVQNVNDTVRMKTGFARCVAETTAGAVRFQSSGIAYSAANAVSGFRLYWASGANFTAVGKVRVYGIVNT